MTRAPAERNVCEDDHSEPATFRTYGAGVFLELAFYEHCVPTGRRIWFKKPCQKKEVNDLLHREPRGSTASVFRLGHSFERQLSMNVIDGFVPGLLASGDGWIKRGDAD